MPLNIVRNDITKMEVDAIVNAANTSLKMGGGVCGAIFNAAGIDALRSVCDKLAPIKTGEAVITKGFKLPAKYIIHTVGPIYQDGKHGEEQLLRSAYTNSLLCAKENNCKSVAFPLISSGSYGYPEQEALEIALNSINDYLSQHDVSVFLVLYNSDLLKVALSLGDMR